MQNVYACFIFIYYEANEKDYIMWINISLEIIFGITQRLFKSDHDYENMQEKFNKSLKSSQKLLLSMVLST